MSQTARTFVFPQSLKLRVNNKSHRSLKKLVEISVQKYKIYKFFSFFLACVDPWKHHMHNNTTTGKVATKELDICSSSFFTYIHIAIKIILFWLFGGSILQAKFLIPKVDL